MYYIFSIILEEGERVTSVNLPYHGPGVRLFFFSKKKVEVLLPPEDHNNFENWERKNEFFQHPLNIQMVSKS
jgi:hypothetical protein